MPVSPASSDRDRRADEVLDQERARVGVDRNRDATDQRLPDARDRLSNTPNTGNGKVQR